MERKILVAACLYPPDIGGPATYAKMIETDLSAHNIKIVTVPFGLVRHLPKIIRHFYYIFLLYKERTNVNAIYALDSVSVGLPALIIAKVFRLPFIVRLGGDYAWEQGGERFDLKITLDEYTANRHTAPLRTRLLAFVQDFVVSRADLVIVPSLYLKSVVDAWRGVEKDKIKVIYSALFPLKVETDRATLRRELNYRDFTIVSAGRLVPWKGFSVLLEVFSELLNSGLLASLIIIGDGPERTALLNQVKKLQLENKVRFPGALSKEALGAAIKAADVFVLNTGYEGLSHQLLEVMDLGVPIVTTKVGGNTELIADGKEGLLCEFNNEEELNRAIISIAKNHELRDFLVQNARLKSSAFSRKKLSQELVDILEPFL